MRGVGRLWSRREDLGKRWVLECRIGIIGEVRKLSKMLLGCRLRSSSSRRGGGGCRANSIWVVGKLRMNWAGEDVYLII